MEYVIVTRIRKYKFARPNPHYAPRWFVMGANGDQEVQSLNLPLSQDDWQKCSTEQVESLLLEEGYRMRGTPAQGVWVLDGNIITNPHEELGDEDQERCKWVETTPAKPGVFVHFHSATDVAAMMANAVNELAVAEAQAAKSN